MLHGAQVAVGLEVEVGVARQVDHVEPLFLAGHGVAARVGDGVARSIGGLTVAWVAVPALHGPVTCRSGGGVSATGRSATAMLLPSPWNSATAPRARIARRHGHQVPRRQRPGVLEDEADSSKPTSLGGRPGPVGCRVGVDDQVEIAVDAVGQRDLRRHGVRVAGFEDAAVRDGLPARCLGVQRGVVREEDAVGPVGDARVAVADVGRP